MRLLVLFFFLSLFLVKGNTQTFTCTDCPVFFEDNTTNESTLAVSGLASGTEICEVSIEFDHTWLTETEIVLIAPDGSSIDLVQDDPGNSTPNCTWDITYVPCDETAVPDPGYPAEFTSTDYSNGDFTGSYYPGDGCFSDLTGDFNGDWTLEVTDFAFADQGEVTTWSITFCGGDPCQAEGGDLDLVDTQYCEGEDIVLPIITGENTDPDYGYSYYIYQTALPVGEPNDLLIVDPDPDITGLLEGMYVICGFSYLLDDEPLLPVPDGVYDSDDFQADIDAEVFCAEVSTFCTAFFIEPVVAAPDLTFPAEVCVGDPSSIVNNNFDPSVTYQITINSGGFSAIDLDPEEITFTAQSTIPIEICVTALSFCGNQTTCANIDVLPGGGAPELFFQPTACVGQQLTITFTEESGNTYSTYVSEGSVSAISLTPGTITYTPDAAGDLQICLEVDGPCGMDEVCADITVFENPEFVWDGPTEVCAGVEVIYSVLDFDPTLGDYAPSIIQGNFLQFIGIGGGQYAVIWNETSTVGEICMTLTTTGCGDLTQCLTVDIISSDADPMIDGPTATCYGGQYTYTAIDLDGVLSYSWSIDASEDSEIIGSTTDPSVLVSIPANIAASASICLDYTTECGMDQVCIDITPEEDFSNPVNNTPATYCSLSGLLDVSADTDVTGQWTLLSGPGTAIYADATMLVTDVTVTDYGQYTFQFEEPDCGGSIDVTVDFLEVTLPIIDGPIEICPQSTSLYTATGLGGQTIVGWTVSDPGILIVGSTTDAEVTVEVPTGGPVSGTFSLCLDVIDACNEELEVCYPVEILNSLVINETDLFACSLDFPLEVTVDGVSGSGLWTLLTGPGTATYADATQSITTATVTTMGDYVFTFVSDECAATINIPVSVVDPLLTTAPVVECFGNQFQVTFEISGGSQPYQVDGAPLTGTTFVSAVLSGSNFTFTVTDAAGCAQVLVMGTADCGCDSDAGTMDVTTLEVCGDALVSVTNQGDEILDADDNLIYVLHTLSGNILGTVLDENTSGTFGFLPSMAYGVTYYVSAVVGDAQSGSVDLTDLCLSVAAGQPIIFFEEPEIFSLSASPEESCTGPFTLTASQSTAIDGIWTTVASPAGSVVVLSSLFGDVVEATVSEAGTYTMQYQIDNGPCIVTDQVTFTYQPGPVTASVEIDCAADNTEYTVSFGIFEGTQPYSVNGSVITGSTFTSGPIVSGSSYSFEVVDANGCTANIISGTFNCGCETNAGTMDLTTLELCGQGPTSIAGNGDETLDSDDALVYILHTGSGAALGTVLDESPTGNFTFLATMTYGTTYYVSVVVADALGASIDFTDDCLSVAPGQPIIFFEEPVISDITNVADDLCDDTVEITATVNIDVAGTWTITSSPAPGAGTLSATTGSQTVLTKTIPGDYIVSYQVTNGPCTVSAFSVSAYVEPVLISAVSYVCDLAGGTYEVTFELSGGVEPYEVDGIPVAGNTFISTPIASGTSQPFEVGSSVSCEPVTFVADFDCSTPCGADAGTMPTDPLEVCGDDTITVAGLGDEILGGGDSLTYILHTLSGNILGDVLQENGNGEFAFAAGMIYGQTYYISAVAGGVVVDEVNLADPCLSVAAGQPVQFRETYSIDLGLDTTICSLVIDQAAIIEGPDLDITWGRLITANETFGSGSTFGEATPSGIIIEFDTAAIYTIIGSVGPVGSACRDTDTIAITVLPALSVLSIDYDCSASPDSFTALLTIAGGEEPYFVDGVAVTGFTYQTEAYASGSTQDIVITDSSICSELVVDLTHICVDEDCASSPGDMPADTVRLCEGGFLQLASTGATVDAADSLVYVLHRGAGTTVVDPLIYSPTGAFPFDSSLLTVGIIYYVSAVTFTGDLIDLEDECTVVSMGTPVVWGGVGSIIYSLPETICFGDDILLTLSYDGLLPAVVVYVDDQGNESTLTIEQTGTQTISLPFIDTESIEFISLTDGHGCAGIAADLFTFFELEVIDIIDIAPETTICNSSVQGSEIDLNTLLGTDGIEGSWQSPVGVLTGSILDVDGVSPGVYTIVFEPTAAYPCGDLTTMISVEDCPCPIIQLEPLSDLCQGEYTFALDEQIPSSSVGTGLWSVAGAAGAAIESDNSLVISSVAVGSYEVSYTLSEVPDGCDSVFAFVFVIDQALSAGAAAIDEVEICIGDLTEILLFDYIEGNDLGGQWTTADDLAVDTLTGTVDAAAADGGLYTYTYTVAASGACPASEASVVLLLNDPLELFLSILDPLCFGQADGSVSVQDMDGVAVTDFSVVDGEGTPMTPTALMGGNYTLTAIDSNGCIYTENFTLVDPVELALDLGDDVTLQEGQSAAVIPVTNIGSGDITLYEWFLNQAALDTPTFDTLILSPDGQTFVELIITDDDGCIVADDLLITIIEETVPVVLPNIFNPQTSAFAVPAYEDIVLVRKLAIYDRWGGLVFSATDFDPSIGSVSWDGSYRGQAAATGVYVYALQYTDRQGRQQSLFGDVALLSN